MNRLSFSTLSNTRIGRWNGVEHEWNFDSSFQYFYNCILLKKFRITHYIIFVHKTLNSRSYSGRYGNGMKRPKQHQWACESTSTNFQAKSEVPRDVRNSKVDLTFILEHPKIRVFTKILRKVKHFKICELQTS